MHTNNEYLGCNHQETPCESGDCGCKVLLNSDCVSDVSVDLTCSNILKGQTLSEVLVQLDQYICERFTSVENFIKLVNIGTGAKIYKGTSSLGKKELRTLLGSNFINLEEGQDAITISVDEAALAAVIQVTAGASQGLDSVLKVSNNSTEVMLFLNDSDNEVGAQIYSDELGIFNATNYSKLLFDGVEWYKNSPANGTGIFLKFSRTEAGLATFVFPNKPLGQYRLATIDDIPGGITSVTGTAVNNTDPLNPVINFPVATIPPFERLNEGAGNGIVIRDRDPLNYGPIGGYAFDLSYSSGASTVMGATGEGSFVTGDDNVGSGYGTTVFGGDNTSNGIYSFVSGRYHIEGGYANTLFGAGHSITDGAYATVVGQYSNVITNNMLNVNDDVNTMFAVGNGRANGDGTMQSRSTALLVKRSGEITAPSLTTAIITADTTGKSLVTKEYLTSVFPAVVDGSETKINSGNNVTVTGTGTTASPYIIASSFTDTNTTYSAGTGIILTGTTFSIDNLQKVITYPTDFTGVNYTLTDTDSNYEIIVDNGATAVTITVPLSLKSKIGIGFTQKGTGDVAYVASGTTINSPAGLKIKGQFFQTFLSQEGNTNVFYLGGNTRA